DYYCQSYDSNLIGHVLF
nr:immunoglobulin light chain junction region [Macaca mulatta]MOX11527.1 immunoglobulin light chain junction region [Macaca mulatta]MOX11638.1 immunoglobulin light chain junction region [Macaca mulatta]MOX11813.1 immunoglobulin light chain junction region [Macaca mulatta]MOX11889.1 immunoglobulin light chain junction region [Macaca mulatta]